jgi:hypothetical protein
MQATGKLQRDLRLPAAVKKYLNAELEKCVTWITLIEWPFEYPVMDVNKDCKVDFLDLKIIIDHWLECNLDPPEACWE